MKFKILCAFILTSLVACNSNSKIQPQANCFIKYDSLFKIIDTSSLEIIRETDSAAIEVLDKKTKSGERGLLRFDNNNNLRYYAFLYNDHNDASFFLTYDSVGNHIRLSKSEVVQWIFYTPKDLTVKFTFLLCALDRNYGDIKIESGKFKKDNIVLFESKFARLICANVTINKSDLDSTKKIYLTGKWQDKCSKLEQTFIDSTIAL